MIIFQSIFPLTLVDYVTPVCGLLQPDLCQSKNSIFGSSKFATHNRHWCLVQTHQARLATHYYDAISPHELTLICQGGAGC
jgi:hypothetical protein